MTDIKHMTSMNIALMGQRELQKLTESELRQAVSTLRNTTRKRYERLIDSDIYSESVEALRKSAVGYDSVLPTIKGMDKTQLFNEFKRYKSFLSSKTSTARGAKKSQKAKLKVIKDITGVDMNADDMRKFYSIYDEAKQSGVGGILNYRQVMDTVAQVYDENPDWSRDKILDEVERRLIMAYEEENSPRAIYPSRTMQDNTY